MINHIKLRSFASSVQNSFATPRLAIYISDERSLIFVIENQTIPSPIKSGIMSIMFIFGLAKNNNPIKNNFKFMELYSFIYLHYLKGGRYYKRGCCCLTYEDQVPAAAKAPTVKAQYLRKQLVSVSSIKLQSLLIF